MGEEVFEGLFWSSFLNDAWTLSGLALGSTLYLMGDDHKGLGALEARGLLESIPDLALIIGRSGEIVEVNSAAAELIGRGPEELRKTTAQEMAQIFQVSDGTGPVNFAEGVVARALKGETARAEHRVVRHPKTAAALELLVSASPIRTAQGKIMGVLVIARDVTELNLLQRRIGDMERHHAIGQMAAALAHDFNNVLDTIGQAVAVLELSEEQPLAERKDVLGMIRNAVRRGAEIISGVREYLRTGEGETGPVDIREVLVETIELTRPLWQRARIHLVTHLQPVATVNGNSANLRRVFANLVINAIEAMPKGGELTISCCERGERVAASIRDTGVGIAREHQSKIFFPYFTTKPHGTGLGLSGAQKIVLAQGGSIGFQSEPGKGTTFTVELPLRERHRNEKTSAA
jgi:PAS domain S-box-containing protein